MSIKKVKKEMGYVAQGFGSRISTDVASQFLREIAELETQRDELLVALKEARSDIARVESGKFCDLRETLREIDAVVTKMEAPHDAEA